MKYLLIIILLCSQANAQFYGFLDSDKTVSIKQKAFTEDTYRNAITYNIVEVLCNNLIVQVPEYVSKYAPYYFKVPNEYLVASMFEELTIEELLIVNRFVNENPNACKDGERAISEALDKFRIGYLDYQSKQFESDLFLAATLMISAAFAKNTFDSYSSVAVTTAQNSTYAAFWGPILKWLGGVVTGIGINKATEQNCAMPTTTTTTTTSTTQCAIGD